MCGEISTKGFSKFCKLMSNLILGQISVSNLNTNVHKRLCIKVGRGQGDGDMGRVCGDLGTRDEGLGDIKYGSRGLVGRGRGDDNDY